MHFSCVADEIGISNIFTKSPHNEKSTSGNQWIDGWCICMSIHNSYTIDVKSTKWTLDHQHGHRFVVEYTVLYCILDGCVTIK